MMRRYEAPGVSYFSRDSLVQRMNPRILLVDLGGTLVDFFGHTTPGTVLPLALASAGEVLADEGKEMPPLAVLEARWKMSGAQTPDDPIVRPLEGRLARTFGLGEDEASVLPAVCRSFMAPLFGQARVFEDSLPFLDALRALNGERFGVNAQPAGAGCGVAHGVPPHGGSRGFRHPNR
jgi:hypothetical protein